MRHQNELRKTKTDCLRTSPQFFSIMGRSITDVMGQEQDMEVLRDCLLESDTPRGHLGEEKMDKTKNSHQKDFLS